MIASKKRYETMNLWQNFLSASGSSLKISRHLRERFKERFPDLPELSDEELLDLVRNSKPLYSYIYPSTSQSGMVVRNGSMIFAICFDLEKVMTIFPYSKKKLRNMNFHQKETYHLKKSAYKRSNFKHEARQIVQDNFGANSF